MKALLGTLGLVSLGVAMAVGCGSTPNKVRQRADGGEGGGGGEPSAPLGGVGGAGAAGEPAMPVGGQGGASDAPLGGAPPLMPTGTGLSLPAALKFAIPCGADDAQATLSLTNWGDEDIELTSAALQGAFTLETQLPLTIASGESGEIVVSTAPGVVGTDAPGDVRQGKLTLTSNLGTATVQLNGAIGSAQLVIDSVPGAALTGPLPFACSSSSSVGLCPTQTFTIVNHGTSNAVLQPPVASGIAVAAFVPGSAQPLTLVPGAAVKVEVRAAAKGSAIKNTTDALSIKVAGSCESAALAVPLAIDGPDNCVCPAAPPGIEAAPFRGEHACGTASASALTIFNGSSSPLDVLSAHRDYAEGTTLTIANGVPFTIESGKSAVLQLLAPKYPGYAGTQAFNVFLDTARGDLIADASWRSVGGSPVLQYNATGASVGNTLALSSCAPVELALVNYGANGPIVVSPPTLSGGVSVSGFTAPQTLAPNGKFVFSVAPVSNTGNTCATTGSLELAVDGSCQGPTFTQAVSYTGACSCDGI